MNIINLFFQKCRLLFRRELNEEEDIINLCEPTLHKRRQNENINEDMPIKKRKSNLITTSKDVNDLVASSYLWKKQPFTNGSKENNRFASRTLKMIDAAVMENNAARDNHQVYCIDNDDEESNSCQKNVTSRTTGLIPFKEMNKKPKPIKIDLSNDEILSVSYEPTTTYSGNALPSQRRHTESIMPELCLNKVRRQQDEAKYVELLRKAGRKSLPLTNSTVHNTKQNTQMFNDTNSNRSYSLRQRQPLESRMKVFSSKIDSTLSQKNAALKAIIDLTGDEDDEAERQEIQSNIASSSEIRNLKSDFIAENSFMFDPDLATSILKKYENNMRNMERQVSTLEKKIHHNREAFHQTISDIFNERLSLKEVTIEEEKKSKELAPITTEMRHKMQEIVASQKYPLVQIKDTAVKLQDIRTLDNTCWLNDTIINAYMNLIKLRAEKNPKKYPKVHCFNTFLYEQLNKKGYSSVRRWTRKVDIFDFEIVIVPIHLGNHWCLIQIRFSKKFIKYYDSMGSSNNRCLKTMLQYLVDEYHDKKNEGTFDTSGWQLINVPSDEIPQQRNVYDCGVFACTYAEHITRNASFSFDQEDMPYFRSKMGYEILTGELLL